MGVWARNQMRSLRPLSDLGLHVPSTSHVVSVQSESEFDHIRWSGCYTGLYQKIDEKTLDIRPWTLRAMYAISVHDEYSVQVNRLPSAIRNDSPLSNANEFPASVNKIVSIWQELNNYLLIRLILTFLQSYPEAYRKTKY